MSDGDGSGLRLGEVICDLVTAKLQAGLPARIAQINVEKSDGLSIDTPSNENYFQSGVTRLPGCPAIIVSEGPTNFMLEGNVDLMAGTLIAAYCWDEDPDRELLGKRLQRLARAVIACVIYDEPKFALDAAAFRIIPNRTIPGRVFEPDQADTWRSFYIVEFAATALEG